ncbi:MAG: hypothetical protein WB580_02800 [Candidatus Binataceae bacterium]
MKEKGGHEVTPPEPHAPLASSQGATTEYLNEHVFVTLDDARRKIV